MSFAKNTTLSFWTWGTNIKIGCIEITFAIDLYPPAQ
jgi:hypothetical protein